MGKLIYVIGPSGSGKDSVLNAARVGLTDGYPLLFAHRYITRPATPNCENHIVLTPHEFETRLNNGLFAMHWQSHGLFYGIGIEINTWIEKGFMVVVNGSREYLPIAAQKYPALVACLINVSPQLLYQRLKKRARESDQEILKRIERSLQFEINYPGLEVIDNNGSLEDSVGQFINLLINLEVKNFKKDGQIGHTKAIN